MRDINFSTSKDPSCKMYNESKRAALSRDNFYTNSQQKHFICADRKEWADFQNAVKKLESSRRSTMKKYESEIKECKIIRKQFELEKQGLIPYARLIAGDQHIIKSTTAVTQEKELKSVRRALAPRASYEASTRPVLNYELISKPPSVPHRIKIVLTKREQRRLQEEEELKHVEESKPEISRSMYLDDAVAMYAKLRNELQRSYTSLPNKRTKAHWDTRPVSVPSKLHAKMGNGHNMPDSSEMARFSMVTVLPRNTTSHTSKLLRNAPKEHLIEVNSIETTRNESAHAESLNTCNNMAEVQEEGAFSDATRGETTPSNEVNSNTTPKTMRRRSIAFSLPEVGKGVGFVGSVESEESTTFVNKQPRSHTFTLYEPQSGGRRFEQRASTLPELKTSRRNSVATRSSYEKYEVNEQEKQVKIERRSSIGATTRSRRSSSIGDQSTTDKLQKLISEQIIGQITNAQRRHSISSTQKTSILKSYARMLRSELQLDEVPESDSPDFSETPFMRSTTKPADQDAEDTEGEEPKKGSALWEKYLQYGQFRSSLTYSEIEEEDTVGVKARRRLSATFFDSAGVLTRKEKASKLKLKKRENLVHQEEEEEHEEEEERNEEGSFD